MHNCHNNHSVRHVNTMPHHTCHLHRPPHRPSPHSHVAPPCAFPKTPTTTAALQMGCSVNRDPVQPPLQTHGETTRGGALRAPPLPASPAAPRCWPAMGAPPPHSTGHTRSPAGHAAWGDGAAPMRTGGGPCRGGGMPPWQPRRGRGSSCWQAGRRLRCCNMRRQVVQRGLQCGGHARGCGMPPHAA